MTGKRVALQCGDTRESAPAILAHGGVGVVAIVKLDVLNGVAKAEITTAPAPRKVASNGHGLNLVYHLHGRGPVGVLPLGSVRLVALLLVWSH